LNRATLASLTPCKKTASFKPKTLADSVSTDRTPRSHVDMMRVFWRAGQSAAVDPELPFKIDPVNERKARESGLSTEGLDCARVLINSTWLRSHGDPWSLHHRLGGKPPEKASPSLRSQSENAVRIGSPRSPPPRHRARQADASETAASRHGRAWYSPRWCTRHSAAIRIYRTGRRDRLAVESAHAPGTFASSSTSMPPPLAR
jgi:hypothetical protein